ncbi:MAG TPA: terminase TerL endonuclease subunit [Pirellulales bacterium]|nr:terminase TerL endonuclease subunit [Pirellulales bacterium]
MIATATASIVNGYISSVLDGDAVVCELTRAAVQRHVDDLDRQSTTSFPYHFDARRASASVDFFPVMLRHSIGDFAGLEFNLEPWQAFGVWSIFGWKRDEDDTRRFRRVYWSTGRKNGKSTWVAGIALQVASMDINPLTGKPESVAECILCATKKEQAEKVTYAEIERMRLSSSHLAEITEAVNKQIKFRHNHGTIRCVGSDRPYDGLNPHLVVKDEVHAWNEYHRKFYDTITTGGGARAQPLDITTTTAGDDQSHLWREEYEYVSRVTRGEIDDESVFGWVFEIDEKDDPLDEGNWIKANPNLGISLKWGYLRQEAKRAAESAIGLNRFTRYHCNRVVRSTERAFDLEVWDSCAGELSDWRDADAIGGGVDLGARDDLAAWALVARFATGEVTRDDQPEYRFEIRGQAYIADDTHRDIRKQPFATWIHNGLIRKSRFPINELRADLVEQCEIFGISDIAYDPYNGQHFSEQIAAEGIAIAKMAQTYSMFNEPINTFHQALIDGRITHDGNPLLRWCVGNAVIARDRTDRWMLDKRDSNEKIDPVVAMVMAYWRASVTPTKIQGSYYL